MRQKHCNDESLIGYLDGELSFGAQRRVRKHLKACWICRTALRELEEEVSWIARSVNESGFSGSDRIGAARRIFLARRQEFERTVERTPQFPVLTSRRFPYPLFAAGGLLACLFLLVIGIGQHAPSHASLQELEAARDADEALLRSDALIHQSFQVTILQTKPVRETHTSRVECWSDWHTRRFVSRQMRAGHLKHAVWRTSPGHEYVYNAAMSPAVFSWRQPHSQMLPLTELYRWGLEPDELELAFTKWLESRDWAPIRIASDFAWFSSQDGVTISAERTFSESGEAVVRLVADKWRGRVHVKASLEIEPGSSLARLEKISFETPERSVAFAIRAERAETIAARSLTTKIFEPDRSLMQRAIPPRAAEPTFVPVPDALPAQVHSWQLDEIEVKVFYALHQVQACLGEPVEVIREPQAIFVRGLTQTPQRKAELFEALGSLDASSLLRTEIRSVDEALPAVSVPAASSESVSPSRLPIEKQLKAHFKMHDRDPASLNRQVVDLANDAVSLADSALSHAWAVRRLAERYPAGHITRFNPSLQALLNIMLRDHVSELKTRAGRLDALLAPALAAVVGEPVAHAEELPSGNEKAYRNG